MIIDSSAIVAILRQEPEAEVFAGAVERHPTRVSAATVLETALVLPPPMASALDRLLADGQLDIVDFDSTQLRVAREALSTYGRGTGSPAQLNLGDCFSYALAKVTGEPLLFKGDDFTHTDIIPAL